jgi:hypothetical protein
MFLLIFSGCQVNIDCRCIGLVFMPTQQLFSSSSYQPITINQEDIFRTSQQRLPLLFFIEKKFKNIFQDKS